MNPVDGSPVLSTNRLFLRPFKERDLALYAELPGGLEPVRRPLRTDHVFMRPDGPGRVMFVPQVDLDDTPLGPLPLADSRVADSLAFATAAVPALADARSVAAVVADWPLLANGLPCVGAVAAVPGYFEAVTDYGITLAPLIARSLVDEVLGQAGNPLLAPFRPGRSGES